MDTKSRLFGHTLFLFSLSVLLVLCSTVLHATELPAENTLPIKGQRLLHTAIEQVISSPKLHASTVGISIIDLKNGKTLFQKNSEKLFHPASTVKLYTSAAALWALGSSHRFETTVAAHNNDISGSTLRGDIWLVGSGDPTLQSSDLAALASQLRKIGIRYIKGDIICDDSAFDDLHYGHGWMWDDQPYKDFAPISALTVNRNTINIFVAPGANPGAPAIVRTDPPTDLIRIQNSAQTSSKTPKLNGPDILKVLRRWKTQENIIDVTGKIAVFSPEKGFTRNIVNPARYTGTVFKEMLNSKGIDVYGNTRKGLKPIEAQVVARHTSEPLSEILIGMNKESVNIDAELLLKTISRKFTDAQGTSEKGVETIYTLLNNHGISKKTIRLVDGSGVSRYNLLTPSNLTSLLQAVYNEKDISSELIQSLPIAGQDGNLENRMQNTAAAGVVRAKTGAMTGVSCLTGYAKSADGDPIAFAVMIEHFIGSHRPFQFTQDQICDVLCRYSKE